MYEWKGVPVRLPDNKQFLMQMVGRDGYTLRGTLRINDTEPQLYCQHEFDGHLIYREFCQPEKLGPFLMDYGYRILMELIDLAAEAGWDCMPLDVTWYVNGTPVSAGFNEHRMDYLAEIRGRRIYTDPDPLWVYQQYKIPPLPTPNWEMRRADERRNKQKVAGKPKPVDLSWEGDQW